MHVLVMTFRLRGLDAGSYWELAATVAPEYARIPGLTSKVWLADAGSDTYGGLYVFADRSALDAYLRSDLVRSLRATPQVADLTVRTFATVEAATRVTGGPLTVVPGGHEDAPAVPASAARPAAFAPGSHTNRLVWRNHEAAPVAVP